MGPARRGTVAAAASGPGGRPPHPPVHALGCRKAAGRRWSQRSRGPQQTAPPRAHPQMSSTAPSVTRDSAPRPTYCQQFCGGLNGACAMSGGTRLRGQRIGKKTGQTPTLPAPAGPANAAAAARDAPRAGSSAARAPTHRRHELVRKLGLPEMHAVLARAAPGLEPKVLPAAEPAVRAARGLALVGKRDAAAAAAAGKGERALVEAAALVPEVQQPHAQRVPELVQQDGGPLLLGLGGQVCLVDLDPRRERDALLAAARAWAGLEEDRPAEAAALVVQPPGLRGPAGEGRGEVGANRLTRVWRAHPAPARLQPSDGWGRRALCAARRPQRIRPTAGGAQQRTCATLTS